ncbi:hypothetical protein MVEN_00688900 [Mycena venus]|uniref:BTB domain-containing protein n=1 Tax=Mycena venus TaxID=2733690 RepID=A0A8H6YH47_9AGAR|nr:hypothetical protein MVEN_00688900 [Mycena venus]
MSSVPENTGIDTPVFVPTHPFVQTAGADAILRSCDGADFHVHKTILSLVSPFFETMFRLPQPQHTSVAPQTVDMEEDSRTLNSVLRFFYPGTQPIVATLDELEKIIERVVGKYDMECVVPLAKQYLEKYAMSHPLHVYGVAFAHGWEDVAKVAAKECLKLSLRVPDTEPPEGIANLTSTAYYNLLRYHFKCATAAKATAESLTWIQNRDAYCWFRCGVCPYAQLDGYSGRSWLAQFLIKMKDALAVKPALDIRNDPLFFEAIRTAVTCSGQCRVNALDNLSSFVTVWEGKIAEEIAKVEWKF